MEGHHMRPVREKGKAGHIEMSQPHWTCASVDAVVRA